MAMRSSHSLLLVLLLTAAQAAAAGGHDSAHDSALQAPKESLLRVLSDGVVALRVKWKLLVDERVPGWDVDVDHHAGVVTLNGRMPSVKARDAAEALAAKVPRVHQIDNRLRVESQAESAPLTRKQDLAARDISDAWITTKVKSALLYNGYMEALSDIDVRTEDGIVTLQGEVDSFGARELVLKIGSDIEGVRHVRNRLVVAGGAGNRSF